MDDNRLSNCKKIGIMGGTFNPIHMGHLLMAQWAKEYAGLDAVIFIPTGNPYMKSSVDILDGEDRLEMVRLSIEGQENFYVSDMEIKRRGNTYTYETLQKLRQMYPEASLFFIAGADCLDSFERWMHPEKILECSVLIAAARNGVSMDTLESKSRDLMERFGGQILLMEFPAIDISSTMIRNRVRDRKSIRYLTTDNVYDYIVRQGFYL